MISGVLLAMAAASILLNLWQWFAGGRFPLWVKAAHPGPLPPLSILKPLKGADSQTEGCLRSWFKQDYPAEMELLFGVADENDPVCHLVRKLAVEFPHRPSKLVVCSPILGPNAKVSAVCYMTSVARHEHLVISDDDVDAPQGFLEQLAISLVSGAALVNCFYMMRPLNFAMAVEAVAVNADFWTQVLQGNMLKEMDFALGAVMATSKQTLQKIGGFETLLNDLADDYRLGHRIAGTGGKLALCPIPVTCWTDELSARKVWNHQLRWARTIRFCRPLGYFASILSNATLWCALAWVFAPFSASAQWTASAGLLVRALTARANYARMTRDNGWLAFGLAPVKDALGAMIWALAFLGTTVTWREQRFRVYRGGKLTPTA